MANQLSWQQVAQYAYNAGFRGQDLAIATAITQPESGRVASVIQSGQPAADTGWGLWQITPGTNADLDPQTNANQAFAKYQAAGNKFTPWTTYTGGEYKQYLSQATAAAQSVQGSLGSVIGNIGSALNPVNQLSGAEAAASGGVGGAITSAIGMGVGEAKIQGSQAVNGGQLIVGVLVVLVGGTILFLSTNAGKQTVAEVRRGISTARHVAETAAVVAG